MAPPLTRKKKDGTPYARPSNIEAAVDRALALDEPAQLRLATAGPRAEGALPTEAIVHLLRVAHRAGRVRHRDALLGVVLARAETLLRKHRGSKEAKEDALAELGILLARGLKSEADGGLDIFEVCFARGVAGAWNVVVRDEIKHAHPGEAPRAEKRDDEKDRNDPADDDQGSPAYTPSMQETLVDLDRQLGRVMDLPDEEREAYTLVRILGHEVESDDSTKSTAATRCGVSGRTIRNRLRRADARLCTSKEDAS